MYMHPFKSSGVLKSLQAQLSHEKERREREREKKQSEKESVIDVQTKNTHNRIPSSSEKRNEHLIV